MTWIGALYIPVLEGDFYLEMGEEPQSTLLVSNGAVRAVTTPAYVEPKVLASMVGKESAATSSNELLYVIIKCESGWDPDAKNPKSTAYGLAQFLDSTWRYVQNKWGVALDRESEADQLYAARRLLKEEGTVHWEPSKECWGA